MDWKSIIIWMKNQATLSMKDYKSRYEPIVYGRFDDTFYGEKAKEEDIWEFQRTLKNDLHPTMKPVPLICNMLEMSSKKDDVVLDLFGGSGSTLIACEQLDRTCYMMEIEPKYIDVIIDRWEQFTGEKAILLNS
jgi:DNA modification methylase